MVMSSMYRVAPVPLSRPSLRGTDLPMMCSSVMRSPKMRSNQYRGWSPGRPRPAGRARRPFTPSYEITRLTVLASNLPPSGFSVKLAVGKHALSPQIRRFHNAAQLFPQVRRYGMPVMQPIFGHDELRFRFEDHEVGIKSFRNSAFASGATSQSSWLFAHPPR